MGKKSPCLYNRRYIFRWLFFHRHISLFEGRWIHPWLISQLDGFHATGLKVMVYLLMVSWPSRMREQIVGPLFVEVMLGFRIDLPKSWFLSANPGRLGGLTFQQWNLWICSQFSGSSTPCRIGVSWCLYILYSVLRMGSLYYIRPIWLSHSVRWSSVPRTRVNLTIFDLSAAVPVKLFQFASNSIV